MISKYNIKKWWRMLTGKSILHVNQGEGKFYSLTEIKGYYNNLTEKVLLDKENYNSIAPIVTHFPEGKDLYFPIAIFQYGLGAYDLYCFGSKDNELMQKKFCAQLLWALSNQNDDGSWDNFSFDYPNHPFSAMAQGEGCSLLIRGYVESGEEKYLHAAKKAIDFMLLPMKEGGTSEYVGDDIILYEFTCFPYVYNGWIFAIFGLMDYVIATDDIYYKQILNRTIDALEKRIKKMDNGYWSMYRNDKTIASPFYHNLHIAQLSVLYKYSHKEVFNELNIKFTKYQKSWWRRKKAFIKKSLQKIFGK